jgi:excisionase family DNA binding protein
MPEAKATDVPGLAEALGIGCTMAKELVKTGEVRSFKIGRKRIIPLVEIDAYMERKLEEQ